MAGLWLRELRAHAGGWVGGKGEDGEETTSSRLMLQSGRYEAVEVLRAFPLALPQHPLLSGGLFCFRK
jgi:hypothetical protein